MRDLPVHRSRTEARDATWRQLAAARVVAHLARSNWQIRRGAPGPTTRATDQELAARLRGDPEGC